MLISKTVIKATAESYTREELIELRKKCLDRLAELDYVSQASTGAGAGYTMSQRAKLEDLIELYSAAIDYLDNDGQFGGADSNACPIVFF